MKSLQIEYRRKLDGFSLLELMTVIVIISILFVLSVQAYSSLVFRAQRASCTSNLQSLYAAASSYVNDNQMWPQIAVANPSSTAYAQAWIDALAPYKIGRINWICPSIQRLLNNPDYTQTQNVRIDYYSTPFDTNPASPSRYPKQPWFAESASVHGDGNLIIFASGQVESLNQVVVDMQTPQQMPN